MTVLSRMLTYAGALPFLGAACCLFFGWTTLPVLGDVKQILSIYGLVIAVFLCGSHWGQHLERVDSLSRLLPLFSNGMALVLWILFLMAGFQALMVGLCLVFLALLAMDWFLARCGAITGDYFSMRVTITAIVTACLAGAGLQA